MENQQEIIQQITSQLLQIMGFQPKIEVDFNDQQNIVVRIETDQAGFLIGQSGANLQALQHIARLLVNKKISQLNESQPVATMPHFMIDVNDYKKHRVELLKELADNMAQQAINEKAPLFLQPMPAYERRVIHLALYENSQVETESVGEGENRRVIIRPKP